MIRHIKTPEERETDFKRNHGERAKEPLKEYTKPCFVCKEETKKSLGIRGAWDKDWTYCPEHYMAAKVERDSFLVKKKHKIYDRCLYHEDVVIDYRSKGEIED